MLVSLEQLITQAQAGQLVSFPTDTVPALAVRPDRSELIFQAKQRSQDKPLILMGDSVTALLPYCQGTQKEIEIWRTVADSYWPGALTLVLPASPWVPRVMNPLDPSTIGVRVPQSAIALQILAQTGPLATTSANRSGQPPLETLTEIDAQFPEVYTLSPSALPESPSASGVPSTVAQWTPSGWQILRQGSVMLA